MVYGFPVEESRRERKKRLTRQRIVEVALGLFEKQGYEKTTVAQIAAEADIDPQTFFNYFRSKDEVLFDDRESDVELMFQAIEDRGPEEGPGEVLARMVREYADRRLSKRVPREPAQLSATARLITETPALQAKSLYLQMDLYRRIAEALVKAFPDRLDPITAAAMTGSLMGAIQQASLASIQLGQTQDELWEASRRGLDVALSGLLNVPPTENP